MKKNMNLANNFEFFCDKIHTSIPNFNSTSVIERQIQNIDSNEGWKEFPESFRKEHHNFLLTYKLRDEVFLHGDLHAKNILVTETKKLFVIDFADSFVGPRIYDFATIACDLFSFDEIFMKGFFGDFSIQEMTDIVFDGLLIHDFGSEMICQKFNPIEEITSLDLFKNRLFEFIRKQNPNNLLI